LSCLLRLSRNVFPQDEPDQFKCLVEAGRNTSAGQPIAVEPESRMARRDFHVWKAVSEAVGKIPMSRHRVAIE
jgi:hypothetical protein